MTASFSKFYTKSRQERLNLLVEEGFLTNNSKNFFAQNTPLKDEVADSLIENQITQFPLPLGVALNFIVDQQEVVIPMAVEEPSVIAACSNGAKTIAKQGGFKTVATGRALIGQIIIQDLADIQAAKRIIETRQAELIDYAKETHPSIVGRGGGVKEIETRIILNEKDEPEFLTIHLIVDVKDAMGANIVNTILEGVTPLITEWVGGDCLMSILSNYNDHALVTATCTIDPKDLTTAEMDGLLVAKKIVGATRYAKLDPYRAATHNKGIMNGIDSVLIATGNDPRAIAAGAHAYCARHGSYQSMSDWQFNTAGFLEGELTLPMPVGIVGGAISILPMAKMNQDLLKCQSALDLAKIIVAVGLAQNFSALKALVSDGIQKGHMNLQVKSLAIHAGAREDEINALSTLLKDAPKMNLATAQQLLTELRQNK